jgi:hypothetical protein
VLIKSEGQSHSEYDHTKYEHVSKEARQIDYAEGTVNGSSQSIHGIYDQITKYIKQEQQNAS